MTDTIDLFRIGARYAVDQHFRDMWDEEQQEALWLFLLAEKAEAEGHSEAAALLRETAQDELKHAVWMGLVARSAELNRRSLVEHIQGCMGGDNSVVPREREMAQIARSLGRDEDAARFERMAEDELEHVKNYQEAIRLLQR